MRQWAESKGVTHFTHWFQPLTGATAENMIPFLQLKSDGTPIEQFDGTHWFNRNQTPLHSRVEVFAAN
jgi:glutamine synthetase type III